MNKLEDLRGHLVVIAVAVPQQIHQINHLLQNVLIGAAVESQQHAYEMQ